MFNGVQRAAGWRQTRPAAKTEIDYCTVYTSTMFNGVQRAAGRRQTRPAAKIMA